MSSSPQPQPRRCTLLWCSLSSYPAGGAAVGDGNHGLTLATRNLFQRMERSAQPVPPMEFILSLRKVYPQFAQTNRGGEAGRARGGSDGAEGWV